jgi:SAM-dependent methyltransferase
MLYDDLSDRVFFVAPGQWTLWQCDNCRSAWLDPRPNEATIGLAYKRYITHEEGEVFTPAGAWGRFRYSLGNGYRNHRNGSNLVPAASIGWMLASLLPPLRWLADVGYRFLPSSGHKSVLDIGCGNGGWLDVARAAGWQVAGVEPDPVSRKRALVRGIEVRESVAAWLDDQKRFDYITINHVIEHVHDPARLLRQSYALLRPGGGIYIDTPHIDAIGHKVFGKDWLALDPPRHLVLLNRGSLADAVSRAGFEKIKYHPQPNAFSETSEQSRRIAAGLDPFFRDTPPHAVPPPKLLQRLGAVVARRHSEYLTLTAHKPPA